MINLKECLAASAMVLGVAVGLAGESADAQEREDRQNQPKSHKVSFGDRMTPWMSAERRLATDIDRETIDYIIEHFELSEEQTHSLEQRYQQLLQRFGEFRSQHVATVKSFAEELDAAPRRSMEYTELEVKREEALAKIADEEAAMDERFLRNLQPILSEDQQKHWERFIHWRNRDQWLQYGYQYLESSIDQIKLVNELTRERPEFRESEALQVVLTQYSRQLDDALMKLIQQSKQQHRHRARTLAARTEVNERGKTFIGAHPDKKAADAFEKRHETRKQLEERLRSINRQYRPAIQAALPDDLHDDYAKAYRAAALGWRMRMDKLASRRFLEQVRSLDSLTDEQREAIHTAETVAGQRAAMMFPAIIEAQESFAETTRTFTTRPEKQRRQEQYEKAFADRYDVEQDLIDTIWLVLTPDQQAEIGEKPTVEYPGYKSGTAP